MSLFSQYLQERTDRQIIETDQGFATYTYIQPDTVYIEDIYVIPSERKNGVASKFANQIIEIAKEKGCKRILGSVLVTAKTSTDSLKVLLAFGMAVESANNNFICMGKDI